MASVLIIFAHPRLEKSRTNKALLAAMPRHPQLTFRDLYELYPDFNIETEAEKRLLLQHDIIIWHHPFYWYSAPPLLKQWIDMVLEFGWAYGPGGHQLSGKRIFNVITTGGSAEAYQPNGSNRFTMEEFLRPFEQTARLCRMEYLPAFVIQGTHRLSDAALQEHASNYQRMLNELLNTPGGAGASSANPLTDTLTNTVKH